MRGVTRMIRSWRCSLLLENANRLPMNGSDGQQRHALVGLGDGGHGQAADHRDFAVVDQQLVGAVLDRDVVAEVGRGERLDRRPLDVEVHARSGGRR